MRRRFAARSSLIVLLALTALSGCALGPGETPDRDIDLDVSIEGTSSALVIDYSVKNSGERDVIAYNRVENSPAQAEFVSDIHRVYVTRVDNTVEIAKRIEHPCHDNPSADDCSAEEAPRWRIGGTIVGPGERLHEHIAMPARGSGGFVETRGSTVTFCLGVAVVDENHPATPDGLYPPTSPQTVLCGDPVAVTR